MNVWRRSKFNLVIYPFLFFIILFSQIFQCSVPPLYNSMHSWTVKSLYSTRTRAHSQRRFWWNMGLNKLNIVSFLLEVGVDPTLKTGYKQTVTKGSYNLESYGSATSGLKPEPPRDYHGAPTCKLQLRTRCIQ